MFARLFILALIAGAFGSVISIVYAVTFGGIIFDFGNFAPSTAYIIAYNLMFTIAVCALFFVLSKAIKNINIAEFIVNFVIATLCMILAFVMVLYGFPDFSSNLDAEIMSFEYFGLAMPLVFIPALSWFAFKPLFIKKEH